MFPGYPEGRPIFAHPGSGDTVMVDLGDDGDKSGLPNLLFLRVLRVLPWGKVELRIGEDVTLTTSEENTELVLRARPVREKKKKK